VGWTDHNVHDPGVTLLELFAFLGEALAYFSDEVTGERRRRTLGRYALALVPLGALIFVYRRRTAATRLPG
jgi:hypothetical protein